MRIHIVGICGRIYASLAKELVSMGHVVTGSDDNPLPPVSEYLTRHGLPCTSQFAAENLPQNTDLVLTNSSCTSDNVEIAKAKSLGIPISNFAQFLGKNFLNHTHNAVVAGSYGKTTTSSMLAWIMKQSGGNPNWLVGGICPNLQDYLHLGTGNRWVLEGDEYRSGSDDPNPKLRYYNPQVGVLTALDYVHQDQFVSLEETAELFRGFASSIAKSGFFVAAETPLIREMILPSCSVPFITTGFDKTADEILSVPRWDHGFTAFQLRGVDFMLLLRGRLSCLNASLASLAAEFWGVSLTDSALALRDYKGVEERQEVILDTASMSIIYDCGMYPLSMAEVVDAVAVSSQGRRLCVLFQPRYTLGNEEVYYQHLGRAFRGVSLLLMTDAVNLPGITNAFNFDINRLKPYLADETKVVEVGPTMASFDSWEKFVLEGDSWLIMVEAFFPQPLNSIRKWAESRL